MYKKKNITQHFNQSNTLADILLSLGYKNNEFSDLEIEIGEYKFQGKDSFFANKLNDIGYTSDQVIVIKKIDKTLNEDIKNIQDLNEKKYEFFGSKDLRSNMKDFNFVTLDRNDLVIKDPKKNNRKNFFIDYYPNNQSFRDQLFKKLEGLGDQNLEEIKEILKYGDNVVIRDKDGKILYLYNSYYDTILYFVKEWTGTPHIKYFIFNNDVLPFINKKGFNDEGKIKDIYKNFIDNLFKPINSHSLFDNLFQESQSNLHIELYKKNIDIEVLAFNKEGKEDKENIKTLKKDINDDGLKKLLFNARRLLGKMEIYDFKLLQSTKQSETFTISLEDITSYAKGTYPNNKLIVNNYMHLLGINPNLNQRGLLYYLDNIEKLMNYVLTSEGMSDLIGSFQNVLRNDEQNFGLEKEYFNNLIFKKENLKQLEFFNFIKIFAILVYSSLLNQNRKQDIDRYKKIFKDFIDNIFYLREYYKNKCMEKPIPEKHKDLK